MPQHENERFHDRIGDEILAGRDLTPEELDAMVAESIAEHPMADIDQDAVKDTAVASEVLRAGLKLHPYVVRMTERISGLVDRNGTMSNLDVGVALLTPRVFMSMRPKDGVMAVVIATLAVYAICKRAEDEVADGTRDAMPLDDDFVALLERESGIAIPAAAGVDRLKQLQLCHMILERYLASVDKTGVIPHD